MGGDRDHLGIGVFETFILRADTYLNYHVVALDRHIARLQAAAVELGVVESQISASAIVKAIEQAVFVEIDRANHPLVLRVRCVVKQSGLSVSVEPWIETLNSKSGISVALYRAERPVPKYKSCSAIISHLARQQANIRGCDEALLVDQNGFVREGAWSNFFLVKPDDTLATPAERILPGITRQLVLDNADRLGIKVDQREVTVPELLGSNSEIFITQATNGVVPVVKIEKLTVGSGQVGRITRKLQKLYSELSLFESSNSSLPRQQVKVGPDRSR